MTTANSDIVAAAEILEGAAEARSAEEIAAAQARADEAQRLAAQLTDAALQTELGRQIAAVREENSSWQRATETTLAALQGTLQEISSRINQPPTAVVVQPEAAPHSLIPGASAEEILPVNPEAAAAGADADGHAEAENEPGPKSPAPRKRRIM